MKSVYKIIFLTLIFIGSISYEAKAQTVVYAPDYSSKTVDGIFYARTKTAVKWASDNVTKTTTYTYADKRTHVVVANISPTINSTVSGIIKTTVATYGNGKKITTKETASLVGGSVSYGSGYSSKSATYQFLDSTTIVVDSALTKTAVKWASDNVTKTTTYTYADKRTHVVTVTVTPTVTVSWASDHITKTTITTYGNGKKLSVITKVPGTVGTPTYNNNIKTVVTTYGDGTSSTATFTASSSSDSWASDHITKTTTHTYASGGSNSIITTVNPTSTTPALTNAVYPSDWTTTGTVTPPNVSSKTNTYGDGYTNVVEDGTSSKPFLQTTLSGLSISDPSKYVTSNTTTYDLRWGTPDKDGPLLTTLFPSLTNQLNVPIAYAGVLVASNTSLSIGPKLLKPSQDVLDAWNNGWTGKGINILMVDDYPGIGGNCGSNCHGVKTMMITDMVAIGATKFLLDNGTDGTTILGVFRDMTNTTVNSSKSINVVNASFGTNYIGNGFTSFYGDTPTDSEINSLLSLQQPMITAFTNFFSGTTSVSNISNVSAAVIVKSAGNDGIDANYEKFVSSYANNASITSRLLIVGALNKDGTVSNKATIENYSNTAGANNVIANRFLVANGNTPYGSNAVSINGWIQSSERGTSYAAPRVAGYAAIIQQKFPGLNAANTSNIILDTARYDTLTCYPSCDTSIYGKGEASLSRALAPVGRLR
jgi:hypothetical protein